MGAVEPSDEETRQLLKEEYFAIEGFIESFDGRMLTIKAWSVSFSLAAIGAAYAADAWPVLIVAAVSGLLFWYIEGMWKTFQSAFFERVALLEKYFAGDIAAPVPLQISRSWITSWERGGRRRLLEIMGWSHVHLPHTLAVALAVTLLVLHSLGIAHV